MYEKTHRQMTPHRSQTHCYERRDRKTTGSVDLLAIELPKAFAMNLENGEIKPCNNGGHAIAFAKGMNKRLKRFGLWAACMKSKEAFLMLEMDLSRDLTQNI